MNIITNDKQAVLTKIDNVFNQGVQKYPLSGPDGMQTGYYGLFDKNGNIVGTSSVTGKYHAHTDEQIKKLARAAVEAFDGTMDIDVRFDCGHHFILTPPRSMRRAIFGTNDNVWARAIVRAHYIIGSVMASIGLHRDACDNLMMLRTVEESTVTINHNSFLDSKMDDLIKQFLKLKDSWQLVADTAEEMQANQVVMSEFLREVFPAPVGTEEKPLTSKIISNYETKLETIFQRVLDERERTGRPTITSGHNVRVSGWEAFNAVQGYMQHKSRRKVDSDLGRIFKAMDGTSGKIVRRAEELALVG